MPESVELNASPLVCPVCGTEYSAVIMPGEPMPELPCCGVTLPPVTPPAEALALAQRILADRYHRSAMPEEEAMSKRDDVIANLQNAGLAMLPMTEARAREIIKAADWHAREYAKKDGTPRVQLDGSFTADELEAFAWWLRNKAGEEP